MKSKLFLIFKSKKAVNDISIAWGIITVFILIGITLPYLNQAYNTAYSQQNLNNLEKDIGENIENIGTINAFTVLFSIAQMFFWTFGDLPFWLDAIFTIFRIMLALVIARNIWIGGGA